MLTPGAQTATSARTSRRSSKCWSGLGKLKAELSDSYGTPNCRAKRLYPPDQHLAGFIESLGVPDAAFKASNYATDTLRKRIKTDDAFVQGFKLEALRETVALDYPSYIFALAMGAGKTILIGDDETTVAVKIIDMLGEEVLVTQTVSG